MNYAKDNYNVTLWWGNIEAFTSIVDDINAQYNEATWRNFASWGRTMITPDWRVNVKETQLNIAAAVLSVNGQKPPRPIAGWNTYGGNIPLIGHAFEMTAADFLTLRTIATPAGDPSYNNRFEYLERLDQNIGGMHSRINMFVYQALSSGYITADKQNNGESIQDLLIDLGFKDEHRFIPTKLWSDPTADPIADLYEIQEKFEDEQIPVTNWLMSKKLIRELSVHPNVMKMIVQRMYPTSTVAGMIPLTRAQVLEGLSTYFEIYPIMEIDEMAAVQRDGKGRKIKSFDESVAVLCTPTNFFELQNCRNVYADDTNPNTMKTSFEGDKFTMIVEYFSNPLKITSSMECFVLPVPRNPYNIGILKTNTEDANWGKRDNFRNVLSNAVVTVAAKDRVIVNGEEYTRGNVINALNTIGVPTSVNMGIKNVQRKVGDLDASQIEALIAELNA